MTKQHKFPLTQKFPMFFSISVYPSPEGGRGATVRGQGYFTLTFEPTQDSTIAQVCFKDFSAKVGPCRILFDIDRDGLLECIDLEGLQFGAEALDLKKSGGEYNLKSGQIRLNWNLTINPEMLKPADKRLNQAFIPPVHLKIEERGWLDLETGGYITNSDIFTIPEGTFTGLTARARQGFPTIGYTRDCTIATVDLGVYIVGCRMPAPPDISPGGGSPRGAPREVWVCPGASVMLLWDATKCESLRIDPDLGLRPLNGHCFLPDRSDPVLGREIEEHRHYTASAQGQDLCKEYRDEIDIWVVHEQQTITLSARYSSYHGCWWTRLFPYQYHEQIKVTSVTIGGGEPDSVTHSEWDLHRFAEISCWGEDDVLMRRIPLGGYPISPEPAFILPATYCFTPVLSSGEVFDEAEFGRKLHFQLALTCGE